MIGAGTTNTNPGPGDVKWVPVYWSTATNPTYSQMHTAWKIGSAKGINKAATYNLYVFFAKYTYTGGQWQETDRIESVRYQFRSAAITTVKLTTPGLSGTSNSPCMHGLYRYTWFLLLLIRLYRPAYCFRLR